MSCRIEGVVAKVRANVQDQAAVKRGMKAVFGGRHALAVQDCIPHLRPPICVHDIKSTQTARIHSRIEEYQQAYLSPSLASTSTFGRVRSTCAGAIECRVGSRVCEKEEGHLSQADFNVAIDMHLTADIHVMLWVCEGHEK